MEPRLRRSARVLPVNRQGEVLLLFGHDPARPDEPYWFSIGGGVEEGENLEVAAVRELVEETGIEARIEQLVGPVHRGSHTYTFDGVAYRSDSTFFALALDGVAVSFDGLDEDERGHILRSAWWDPEQLRTAPLSNPELPDIVASAVAAIRNVEGPDVP